MQDQLNQLRHRLGVLAFQIVEAEREYDKAKAALAALEQVERAAEDPKERSEGSE